MTMRGIHALALVVGASVGFCSTAQAQRTLDDGTVVVSPLVMAAEMIVDEGKARRKYAGKALQLEGPISAKLVTDRGLDLTFLAQPPGYLGYKKFWCRSTHQASEKAAEQFAVGQKVTIVGIYEPDTRKEQTREEIMVSSERGSDWSSLIRLDSCVLLTGNPHAELDRSAVAAKAARQQEQAK